MLYDLGIGSTKNGQSYKGKQGEQCSAGAGRGKKVKSFNSESFS